MNERLRRRLELRRSNAAVPHRNRYRERKTAGVPYDASDVYCEVCGQRLRFGLCEDCDQP